MCSIGWQPDAAAVVTDDYPTFIARVTIASVPPKLDVAFYAVDASCIVPMASFEKREYAAYTIRPKIHKLLPRYLAAGAGESSSQTFRAQKSRAAHAGHRARTSTS